MAGILRWLSSGLLPTTQKEALTVRDEHLSKATPAPEPEPEIVRVVDSSLPKRLYFAELEHLTSSVSARNYSAAAAAAAQV